MNGWYAVKFKNGWKLINVGNVGRYKNCVKKTLHVVTRQDAEFVVFKMNH